MPFSGGIPYQKLAVPELCVNGNEEFERVSMRVYMRECGDWESLLE